MIFDEIDTFPPPIDICRALAIPGWMDESELYWLAERAREFRRIIEIGSFKGRSTRALADHCAGIVTVVDHWLPSGDRGDLADNEYYLRGSEALVSEWRANLADLLETHRIGSLRMHSLAAAADLRQVGMGADFVFIDGDHTFLGCLGDILAYEPLVEQGGIIGGHDYTTEAHPGVRTAVDRRFGGRVQQGPGSIWWVSV